MKAAIIALIVLTVILTAVILNSYFVSRSIHTLLDKLKNAPSDVGSYEIYEGIHDEFTKKLRFISLTVSHDDLTNIESELNEILGAIEAKDEETLIIAKSRLIGSLSHLRRLSGINADSIF